MQALSTTGTRLTGQRAFGARIRRARSRRPQLRAPSRTACGARVTSSASAFVNSRPRARPPGHPDPTRPRDGHRLRDARDPEPGRSRHRRKPRLQPRSSSFHLRPSVSSATSIALTLGISVTVECAALLALLALREVLGLFRALPLRMLTLALLPLIGIRRAWQKRSLSTAPAIVAALALPDMFIVSIALGCATGMGSGTTSRSSRSRSRTTASRPCSCRPGSRSSTAYTASPR